MKFIHFFLIVILLNLSLQSQNSQKRKQLDSLPNTVKNQFAKAYYNSGTYRGFKVIEKEKFIQLQKNVLDSISLIEKNISTKEEKITKQQTVIGSLNDEIKKLNEELTELKNIENSKKNYTNILWSIIGVLAVALLFFIYQFKNSNSLTREAKKNLAEVELEFEDYKRRSLEREQKLRRQLQDEINKQRGV